MRRLARVGAVLAMVATALPAFGEPVEAALESASRGCGGWRWRT